ncbi:SPASM domain-containing protein [Tautonia plasticadhaerens]|uniref:SPASM domain-containing protein n=1 Tax=Tautonia plasticadhaerens TaxID=2527974 RepID=UPI0018D26948|nr:SPASM domain-containing protein [Tautonia plasticadhaerens]
MAIDEGASPPGSRAFCILPFVGAYVRPDGSVLNCCCQRSPLGNLLESDFEAIWFGPLAGAVRRASLTPALHPICRESLGCPVLPRLRAGEGPDRVVGPLGWPTALSIALPDRHCNIGGESPTPETACIMCPRAHPGFDPPAGDHTDLIVGRLARLMPHLEELEIHGVAEAFWKARIFDVLDGLGYEAHADRVRVATISNGTTLSRETRRRWLGRCPRSRLLVSIDAATPATYRAIRRLDAYEVVIENVRRYARERGPGQALAIGHNINELNLGEVVRMVEVAAGLGVDALQMNLTIPLAPGIEPYLIGPRNAPAFADAHGRAVRRAAELGLPLEFVNPLELPAPGPGLVTLPAPA